MKLNVSSGSYNVRESELYKGICPPGKLIRCRVHFLDDSEGNFEIDVWKIFPVTVLEHFFGACAMCLTVFAFCTKFAKTIVICMCNVQISDTHIN